MRTRRPGFVGFVLLILGAATAGAQMEVDTARSLEVTLELYSSRDAFVLLRSIAGARSRDRPDAGRIPGRSHSRNARKIGYRALLPQHLIEQVDAVELPEGVVIAVVVEVVIGGLEDPPEVGILTELERVLAEEERKRSADVRSQLPGCVEWRTQSTHHQRRWCLTLRRIDRIIYATSA